MPTRFLSCRHGPFEEKRSVGGIIVKSTAPPRAPQAQAGRIGEPEGSLLLAFLALFIPALLYIFRSFDANTLASWRWVFPDGFTGILPRLGLAILVSLTIARVLPLERYPIPVLTVAAALTVIPLWNMPEMLLDSGRYFLQAKYLSTYGALSFLREWGHAVSAWTDLPLIPFVYGLVLRVGNESRYAVQFFNTGVFILSLLLVFRIGTLLWNRETGLYGALFLLAMPYLSSQVPQMLVDIHAMFFLLLATCCFLSALRSSGHAALPCASAALAAAMLVKYSLWPMLTLLPAACLLVRPQHQWPVTLKKGALIVIPALGILAAVLLWKRELFGRQLHILLTYQRPALDLWGEGLLSSLLFQCHPFLLLLAVFSVFRAWAAKDRRYFFILLFCLLIVMLGIRRIRYMIPLLPFLSLLAAYGLMGIREVRLRRLTAAVAVTTSVVIAQGAYLPFFRTTSMMNLQEAGSLLNGMNGHFAEVTVLPQEKSEGSSFAAIALLDLFTDKAVISRQKWPDARPPHIPPLSPLRFTWQLRKPPWYEPGSRPEGFSGIRVRISSQPGPEESRPGAAASAAPGFHFNRQAGVFRYRTFVTVQK